jgi:Ca2+-binding RTX toxin-like protein
LATGTVNVSLVDGAATPVGNVADQAEWLVGSGSNPLTMIGSAGADRLMGGAGADTITGGAGADTLTGGGGTDHFVYNAGGPGHLNIDSSLAAMDHITDFTTSPATALDSIDLNGFGFAADAAGVPAATAVTATTVKAPPTGSGFTAVDTPGYFSALGAGVVVNAEKMVVGATTTERIYVDANHDGSFELASDLVIQLDNFAKGLTNLDFHFH